MTGIVERDVGAMHVRADIGCHTFATLPPFNIGNTVLGYGLGLSSAAAVSPHMGKRTVSIMGDGGFWHNGLTSGVAGSVFNKSDDVLIIMNNGYTAATGGQGIPSTRTGAGASAGNGAARFRESGTGGSQSIEAALRGVGVKWVRRIPTYSVGKMASALRGALSGGTEGIKVSIADGECQLMRQRRYRPWFAARRKAGHRVVRTRFGVDERLCTGDHSCIRLSGCPSLTVKESSDPLRTDPVAHVNNDCVGDSVRTAVAMFRSYRELVEAGRPEEAERFVLFGVRPDTSGDMIDVSVAPLGDTALDCGVNPRLVRNIREALDTLVDHMDLPYRWLERARRYFRNVKIVATGGFTPQRIRQFETLQVPVDIYGVGSFFFEGENNDFTADIVRVKIDGSWHDMAKTGRGARQSVQTHPVVY